MFKIAQDFSRTEKVTDSWFKKLEKVKQLHEGYTFTPTGDGSRKMMAEGLGLEKFKGFKDLNSFKHPLGPQGMFVDNIEIPHTVAVKRKDKKHYSEDLN